jgi:hypothetical protein
MLRASPGERTALENQHKKFALMRQSRTTKTQSMCIWLVSPLRLLASFALSRSTALRCQEALPLNPFTPLQALSDEHDVSNLRFPLWHLRRESPCPIGSSANKEELDGCLPSVVRSLGSKGVSPTSRARVASRQRPFGRISGKQTRSPGILLRLWMDVENIMIVLDALFRPSCSLAIFRS